MSMKTSNYYPCHLDLTVIIYIFLMPLLSACGSGSDSNDPNTTINRDALTSLGEKIYFDTNLSNPVGLSCASCHLPSAGFAEPDNSQPTSEGAVSGRFGSRNAPTASYAAHIPEFGFNSDGRGSFFGGQFLDGRVSTLEQQAQKPFLGELEMNMSDEAAVVTRLAQSDYADDFEVVFGEGAFDNTQSAYEQIAEAIAAFERTDVFSPFNSKFDAVEAGNDVFTFAEQRGFALFNGRANCDRCHESDDNEAEIFTDYEFKNIGVPANPDNPFLTLDTNFNPDGMDFVDFGLGAVLNDNAENGKFRTPTLRNIALTPPYMHNGVFDTLTEVVEFYNRRNIDAVIPEVNQNVDNRGNIGNLGLSNSDIQDLVAFMETLSDS